MAVALFDFCGTLVDFQTADAYVRYVQRHTIATHPGIRILYELLDRSHMLGPIRRVFPTASIDKKLILMQLKGRTYEECAAWARSYYLSEIRPRLILPVLARLQALQAQGYQVYLASGGYDIYLRYFVEEFSLDGCIASHIGFHQGVCTGRLEGPDCMYHHKVEHVRSALGERAFGEGSVAFSDSPTDLPMLEAVAEPVVVSHLTGQEWAAVRGYEQLVWN